MASAAPPPRRPSAAVLLLLSAVLLPLLSWLRPAAPGCVLRYGDFHLRFSLPLLALAAAAARPLLTPLDMARLVLLPAIAFVWTTPWDNEIVRQGAWSYPPPCVMARVGWVPVEEYAFFIIQSLLTTLQAVLLLRWLAPTPARAHRPLLFLLPLGVFFLGARFARPGEHSYYAGMIAWWAALPLALLWWGTQGAWMAMPRTHKAMWAAAWLAPSALLCALDRFAIHRGTWHITETTSFNIFPLPDLPIEEMCFFLVTNLILISASLAFDTCALQLRRTHASQTTPLSPSYMPLRASSLAALWTAFVAAPTGPSAADADAEVAERVLSRASASFAAAARLLPWDLRRDLASLYALCRAADDAIDEAPLSAAEQRARLELLHAVGAAAFCQDEAQSDEAARAAVRSATQAYAAAKGSLGAQGLEELRACACACIPLRRLVPLALWQELLRGYAIDVALGGAGGRVFTQPQELLDYAQCVAGVVGEMCVRVVLGRSGAPVPRSLAVSRDVDAAPPREALALLLWQARRMGVALQLVNVARDVVGDARTLRRCYLVFERPEDAWMAPALAAGQLGDGTPSSKGPTAAQLRPHVLALLQRAEGLFASAAPALDDVPSRPARAGLRAACAVYFDIAQVIRHQPREAWERGDRAVVPKWRRAVVALRAVYA